MVRRAIRTERAPAPVAGAPYSQAVAAAPGEIIWVSGQVPLDLSGSLVGSDIATQTRQCLANIAAILREAGATMDDVVKTTVYLTDLSSFGEMNAVYGEAFGHVPPARATVEVSALPAGATVEIEAIAVIGRTA